MNQTLILLNIKKSWRACTYKDLVLGDTVWKMTASGWRELTFVHGDGRTQFFMSRTNWTKYKNENFNVQVGASGVCRQGELYKEVYEIPAEKAQPSWIDGWFISEEEVLNIIKPCPPIVKQLVEIMEKYGEVWRDDTKEAHVDDFNLFAAAEAIHEALKTNSLTYEQP